MPLDSPIPDSKIPAAIEGGKSYLGYIRQLMDEGPVTVRDLYLRYAPARGGNIIVGGPVEVADMMEEWFTSHAADGFMIGLSYVPSGASDFVELVVPELRRRGLFREGYEGKTLREHLGLKRPANRHARG